MSTAILALQDELSRWRAYLALCKLKVVALIVFTAVVGMLLAVPGVPSLTTVLFATLGIGLAAASAAAINHVVDEKIDKIMGRTARRPLPNGHIRPQAALQFALLLGLLAMTLLLTQINGLTALLTFLSLIGYAVIYTIFLKHLTPQNIVIGGAAGAAPPLLGWVAMTGSVSAEPLLLSLIIYTWTPPHFWALAIHREQEYAKAGIPMLPVTHGVDFTRLQILLYTILLLIVSVLPYLIQMSGLIYLSGALSLGLGFLYYAIRLYCHTDSRRYAMPTFGYSIYYLMGIFAFLLIDHYWA